MNILKPIAARGGSSVTDHATEKMTALDRVQAIIEFNMDGTIITANKNFLDVVGYSLEEIRGQHHSMFADPDYAESDEYRQFWADLNRGEFKAAQYKRFGKGGKEIWIEASYNPLIGKNGKPFRVVKFATDITKQTMANAEFRGKVEAINRAQAVIEFEMDGTILDANENFLAVMGYTLDEVRGKHHSMFAEPEFAASAEYREFWAKLNRGEYQAAQYKRLGKGGKEVWIEASYNPIIDPNGKPLKVVKFATDLTPRKAENQKLADEFQSKVQSLVDTVAGSADKLEGAAQGLTAAAQETDNQSQTVAAATEELTMSVSEIMTQIERSNETIRTAVEDAQKSEKQVAGLVEAASKVGEVTSLISDIADQTNLLALNATIEAARAGEAGKGFAIVAQEVKALASQTAKATEEIESHTRQIQSVSNTTAEEINNTIQVIQKIDELSSVISQSVSEQSQATSEVAQNIAGVQTAAAESGRASTDVHDVSRHLSEQFVDLRARVSDFIDKVRAM